MERFQQWSRCRFPNGFGTRLLLGSLAIALCLPLGTPLLARAEESSISLFAPPALRPLHLPPVQEPSAPQKTKAPGRPFLLHGRMFSMPTGSVAGSDWVQVAYAGGTAKLSYPPGWNPSEMIAGREILFALSLDAEAQNVPQKRKQLKHGFWMSFHFTGRRNSEDLNKAMHDRLSQRLERIVRGPFTPLGKPVRTEISGYAALYQAYVVAPKKRLADRFSASSKQKKKKANENDTRRAEFHLIVPMQQGWFELHGVSPESKFPSLQQNAAALVSTLQLNEPVLPSLAVKQELKNAAPILGHWKAISSQLELRADGTIVMQFDRKRAYRLDSHGHLNYKKPVRKLQGTFIAEGDTLFVTWSDHSEQAFKWRLAEGSLFLTDNEGLSSQLNRLLK